MDTRDSSSPNACLLILDMAAALIAQVPKTSEMLARARALNAVRPNMPRPAFLPAEPEVQCGKLPSASTRHPPGLHARHRAEPA